MSFQFLNTVEPCLIAALHLSELNCPPSGTSFGRRMVKHYELDFITWGEGYIITDGNKIPVQKGDLFFRKPGMIVEGFAPYHCYYITFDMFGNDLKKNSGEPLISETNVTNYQVSVIPEFPVLMNVENFTYIETLFFQLFNEYIIRNEVGPFITRTYLMQLLLYMYNQWMSKNRIESMGKSMIFHYQKILSVKEYIDNNISLRFNLDMLVEMSGISRYFFCRIFKKIVGESPINYVNICKINTAKRLLVETEKSVKEIISECGFDNESHFYKLFKKSVGVSPAVFGYNNKIWRA